METAGTDDVWLTFGHLLERRFSIINIRTEPSFSLLSEKSVVRSADEIGSEVRLPTRPKSDRARAPVIARCTDLTGSRHQAGDFGKCCGRSLAPSPMERPLVMSCSTSRPAGSMPVAAREHSPMRGLIRSYCALTTQAVM